MTLKSLFFLLPLGAMLNCSNPAKSPKETPVISPPEQKVGKIEMTRERMMQERKGIERFIEVNQLSFERTGTGLYYQVYHKSADTTQVEVGNQVTYSYRSMLLDGTPIAESQPDSPEKLFIEKEDALIGIHEGLKLLSPGDSAIFILPSHLAYGVSGDGNFVGPNTSLLYEIYLFNVK